MQYDYVHQAADVFIFNIPLPKDVIVARFSVADINSIEEFRCVLSEQLQCDVGIAFSEICSDEAIPWNQLTGIAATLRILDADAYHDELSSFRPFQANIHNVTVDKP